MKDELKRPYDNRPSLIVYMILRVLIILAAVRAVFLRRRNYAVLP